MSRLVRRPALRWLIIPASLAIITALYLGHAIFPEPDHVFPGKDLQEFHYPLLTFVVSAARSYGELPLWNPHQFLGYSVVGNPQNNVLYPPNWTLLLLSAGAVPRGITLLIVLHVFWAALGTVALARSFDADRWGAVLAGAIVGLGCPLAARIYAGHYALLASIAWTPWIIAGFQWAIQRRKLWWSVPGGVAFAFEIMAGHPQMISLSLLAMAALWITHMVATATWRARLLVSRQAVAIGIVGLVLSAISWLPMIDYLPHTTRSHTASSLEFANENALQARELITWVAPFLFGQPLEDAPGYWQDWRLYEEIIAYVGILPLLLAGYAVRRRTSLFFALLIGIGIIWSLGVEGALYWVQYRWLPMTRGFRAPGRALWLTAMGIAGLAALAVTDLRRQTSEERRQSLASILHRVIPAGLAILWLGALILSAAQMALPTNDEAAARVGHFAEQLALAGVFWALAGTIIWVWTISEGSRAVQWAMVLTLAVVILDVLHVSWKLVETGPAPVSPAWQAARAAVPQGSAGGFSRMMQAVPPVGPANGASWIEYDSIQGYDPLNPLDWFNLMGAADWSSYNSPVSRLLGVRFILSGTPLDDPQLTRLESPPGSEGFYFYENSAALPRAYLVERYEYEADQSLTLQRIAMGHLDGGNLALLAEDPACPIAGDLGTVPISRYTPNEVTLDLDTAGPGLVVLSDQYDDDWRVEVDGRPAHLLRANYALRAVCFPEGAETIRFTFRPKAYRIGRAVSLAGVIGLSAGLLVIAARRLRSSSGKHSLPMN